MWHVAGILQRKLCHAQVIIAYCPRLSIFGPAEIIKPAFFISRTRKRFLHLIKGVSKADWSNSSSFAATRTAHAQSTTLESQYVLMKNAGYAALFSRMFDAKDHQNDRL
ncbi:MAG: hypothetical protein ACMZ66_12010 [Thalassospira sp.]|uniref:hypothetical protein n=1 Tax=Thalassospira sp. TaxID=1912094 RepID=UPI003A89272F